MAGNTADAAALQALGVTAFIVTSTGAFATGGGQALTVSRLLAA
jgi:hypothetical protein